MLSEKLASNRVWRIYQIKHSSPENEFEQNGSLKHVFHKRMGPRALSPPLQDLLKSNILLCNERQLLLSDKLGQLSSSAWNVDFTTGTLAFGSNEFVLKNIQIIGSYSNVSNAWSWSWCNQSFSTFPEEVLEDAFKAKKFGERYKIPEFVREEKLLMDRSTAMALAMAVVDIVGADAFYPADINNGSGIAFITVRDERLSLPGPNESSTFIKHFPRLLTSTLDSFPDFVKNQLEMVEDYCVNRGLVNLTNYQLRRCLNKQQVRKNLIE
jgi:hypothetical protein